MGRNLFRRRPSLRESSAYASSGDPATRWYQELAPGGLTNHWTGAVPRFAAEHFVEGARLHERYRWPVGYADLEPYYDRVERLLGVASDPEACRACPPPVCAIDGGCQPTGCAWPGRQRRKARG